MRGNKFSGFYKNEVFIPDTVEAAKQREKDAAQLRLARITNNAEPAYQNGHPKSKEKHG